MIENVPSFTSLRVSGQAIERGICDRIALFGNLGVSIEDDRFPSAPLNRSLP